jgi:NADPH2:quinone reductase
MATVIRLKAPGGADQLIPITVELAPPQDDEIRVRQTAIGVNFIDVYQRMGLYPLPPAAIPGVEAVGVVTAVGANVTSPLVGDRIAYAGAPVGAYASERNLPAWRAVRLPEQAADEVVASVFVKGITAHMLLTRVYPVGAGTTVLIHSAAGGLGQLMTRWAKYLGATVIGTVGSDSKAVTARNAGAHHVIVGRDADFARAVADLTGPAGPTLPMTGWVARRLRRRCNACGHLALSRASGKRPAPFRRSMSRISARGAVCCWPDPASWPT